MMSNNAGMIRFLMLTLGFTAAFMHVFGVGLLQWQISHSSLYAYTLALSSASLSGTEGLNTVLYTVTCLAIGAFAAWVFGICLQACEYALHLFPRPKCHANDTNIKLDVVCGRRNKP
ncbi:hypothetical protein GE278_24185 (plasmid) [Enterobacteriaceae bacterium Kacie_13]|nr:hypothetical protein GE278_24185 [Enterobacteriaceae bacterium Kacie_13]